MIYIWGIIEIIISYIETLLCFKFLEIAFGRTGTRFSNYEHFYLLMNNSG